ADWGGARPAKQAQMCRDDAQRPRRQVQIDHQRASGFEARQIDLMNIRDCAVPIKDEVAMPAMPALRKFQGDGSEVTFPLEGFEIKDAGAIAKAAVSLLKGDHIGLDFLDDRQRPVRDEATPEPYALAR